MGDGSNDILAKTLADMAPDLRSFIEQGVLEQGWLDRIVRLPPMRQFHYAFRHPHDACCVTPITVGREVSGRSILIVSRCMPDSGRVCS